jgi:malonyl-CoA decarboxylase
MGTRAPRPFLSSQRGAARGPRAWLERLWQSIADRGRNFAPIPARYIVPLERACILAQALLSERGEASGAAVARELLAILNALEQDHRRQFLSFITGAFQPDPQRLSEAARGYLAESNMSTAAKLAEAAEPPRQELLRRMNMAPGGTSALVALRKEIPAYLSSDPALKLLDADLRHLFLSWFNRGFLQLRRIDWETPAAVLEKLIAYEAVHEIQGWEDLRRRLAPDRRCFAFFHPSLPGEPLIFVEVALVNGLTNSIGTLLNRDTDEDAQQRAANEADTAIFYSISNCQDGLRGISFGNFLIKQVVEDLRIDLPGLRQFSTLSPIPGFRRWLEACLEARNMPDIALSTAEGHALFDAASMPLDSDETPGVLKTLLSMRSWNGTSVISDALQPVVLRLCAIYLTRNAKIESKIDPVARFHLGNGARLECINWMGNPSQRGFKESYGLMVNYLYDPGMIEANHENFVQNGTVAQGTAVSALLASGASTATAVPARCLVVKLPA